MVEDEACIDQVSSPTVSPNLLCMASCLIQNYFHPMPDSSTTIKAASTGNSLIPPQKV